MHDDIKLPVAFSNLQLQQAPAGLAWIWEGVVAEGAVTLLSAPEKTGKTTLLSLLLDRRRAGGMLLGRAVYPGKTVLASEENDRLWSLRQPPLDFGPDLIYAHPSGPTRRGWGRFIEKALRLLQNNEPLGLLVIDTAARLMPVGLRNPRLERWALNELSLVTQESGVLILNQSRNIHRPLAAYADIVVEMALPGARTLLTAASRDSAGEPTRRRHFTGVGRYPGTLASASAELNAAGTDYVLLEGSAAPPPTLLATLQTLLSASPEPLTQRELLARWPGVAPRGDCLWRALARGLETGQFTALGAGTRNDPYRYELAAGKVVD